jgi:hypothetical protein
MKGPDGMLIFWGCSLLNFVGALFMRSAVEAGVAAGVFLMGQAIIIAIGASR